MKWFWFNLSIIFGLYCLGLCIWNGIDGRAVWAWVMGACVLVNAANARIFYKAAMR